MMGFEASLAGWEVPILVLLDAQEGQARRGGGQEEGEGKSTHAQGDCRVARRREARRPLRTLDDKKFEGRAPRKQARQGSTRARSRSLVRDELNRRCGRSRGGRRRHAGAAAPAETPRKRANSALDRGGTERAVCVERHTEYLNARGLSVDALEAAGDSADGADSVFVPRIVGANPQLRCTHCCARSATGGSLTADTEGYPRG